MPKKRDENAPYWVQLRESERQIILYALEYGKTLKQTAMLLGIASNYLSERTKELGIKIPESKPGPKPGTKPSRLSGSNGSATQPALPVVAKPALRVVAPEDPIKAPAEDEELEDDDFDDDDIDDIDDDVDDDDGDEVNLAPPEDDDVDDHGIEGHLDEGDDGDEVETSN